MTRIEFTVSGKEGRLVQRIEFTVSGCPQPGGSKTATLVRRKGGAIVFKDGRPLIAVRDACKRNPEWKNTVRFFAGQVYDGEPLSGPLELVVEFVMPRPKGHFGSGRNANILKSSAPQFHTSKPDATKLMRALEDALTGTLWADDSQIAKQSAVKVYGSKPGAHVVVTALSEIQKADERQPMLMEVE